MSAGSEDLGAFEEYRRLLEGLPKGIAGSIELVASQLAEPARSLLRLLAIPHSFDVETVAVLMPELDRAEATAAIDEIRPLAFVIRSEQANALHDDVRHYLFNWWLEGRDKDPARWQRFRAASARLAAHYAALAERSIGDAKAIAERQRIFHLVGADEQAGFDAFQHLCRIERYRYRLESCEALIKLIREYEPVLSPQAASWLEYHEIKLLMDLHQHEQAKARLDGLMAACQSSPNPALVARCMFRVAALAREARDLAKARRIYDELQAYATTHDGARDQLLKAMQGLGSLLVDMGQADAAAAMLNKVVKEAERTGDHHALATAWNTFGILHRKYMRHDRALAAFTEALRQLDLAGEASGARQLYNNIGLLHADRAEWEPARENLEKSRDIAHSTGDTNGEATALSNLGRVYLALGQAGEALAAVERAIQLFQEVRNWYGAGMTSRGIARYYRRLGRKQEARAAFIRAQEQFRRGGLDDRANEIEQEIQQMDRPAGTTKWVVIAVVGGLLVFLLILLVALVEE